MKSTEKLTHIIIDEKPLIPFWYQNEGIQALLNYKDWKIGNPLVVAPTGSGKSLMIAEFIRIIKSNFPNQKILVLSHDMEILSQDYLAIKRQNPGMEVGLYSASLKSRTIKDITVAGIQSIYNKPELFAGFNLILLDEAHTVPYDKNSRYRKFFNAVKLPIAGFTATPFRLGTGFLHLGPDSVFKKIVYDIKIDTLQNEDPPRLCKVVSKFPGMEMNASQIKKQAGDFIIKELSLAFDRDSITDEIVNKLVNFKDLRKKWLVYAIDIEHCEHIAEKLEQRGIKSEVVHSKTGISRDQTIKRFKNGEYQALVSVAMLTTGVDIPEVDMIALLRPTSSPVLHIQIIGRGMRVASGKENCLVLDFAGNLKRNGPIDKPVLKISGKGNGEAIMKVCEMCDEIVPIATRTCPSCGAEFKFKHNLSLRSSNADIISKVNWHKVTDIEYRVFVNRNKIPMLQVDHICGLRIFMKLVPIEHGGKATYFAKYWWERRSSAPFPKTVADAIILKNTLKSPREILVDESGKYAEIKDNKF